MNFDAFARHDHLLPRLQDLTDPNSPASHRLPSTICNAYHDIYAPPRPNTFRFAILTSVFQIPKPFGEELDGSRKPIRTKIQARLRSTTLFFSSQNLSLTGCVMWQPLNRPVWRTGVLSSCRMIRSDSQDTHLYLLTLVSLVRCVTIPRRPFLTPVSQTISPAVITQSCHLAISRSYLPGLHVARQKEPVVTCSHQFWMPCSYSQPVCSLFVEAFWFRTQLGALTSHERRSGVFSLSLGASVSN